MDITIKKTVDMLTNNSVSILTQKFVLIGDVETKVGDDHRCAYINSESGRKDLVSNEPNDVINAVMSIWGDNPTCENN